MVTTLDTVPRITRTQYNDANEPASPSTVTIASVMTQDAPPAYTPTASTIDEQDTDSNAPIPVDTLSTASSPSSSVVSLPTYADAITDAATSSVAGESLITDGSTTSTKSVAAIANAVRSAISSDPHIFYPTTALHVRAQGKALIGFPLPTRPDPIGIFHADPFVFDKVTVDDTQPPTYVSLRQSRGSNSCYLVRGDDDSKTPLCSTLYRCGPFRPPHIRFPEKGDAPSQPEGETSKAWPLSWDKPFREDMLVEDVGMTTRTQTIKTPYGLFRWRYASRRERNAHPATPSSLLLMEKLESTAPVEPADNDLEKKKKKEKKEKNHTVRRVAELIRGQGTRTAGSSRTTAGNGGLLRMDLREWMGDEMLKRGAEEDVRLLTVAGCLCMLKKEVDRRRTHQAIVIAGAASGGA